MRATDLDLLSRLWSFSMHGQMPIWIAGQLQALVVEKLGVSDACDVDEALGRKVVEISSDEVARIRARERLMVEGVESI
jgi:hypothetical protein